MIRQCDIVRLLTYRCGVYHRAAVKSYYYTTRVPSRRSFGFNYRPVCRADHQNGLIRDYCGYGDSLRCQRLEKKLAPYFLTVLAPGSMLWNVSKRLCRKKTPEKRIGHSRRAGIFYNPTASVRAINKVTRVLLSRGQNQLLKPFAPLAPTFAIN